MSDSNTQAGGEEKLPAYWHVLGLNIERKIGLTVIGSLLLGAVTFTYQAYSWWRGPDVKLLPPEQVFLFSTPNNSVETFRVQPRMTLINDGAPGYTAIITYEGLRFWFESQAGKPCSVYEQRWHKLRATIKERKNESPISVGGEDTVAYSVPAGQVESHETAFSPFRITKNDREHCDIWHNYLSWTNFLKQVEAEQAKNGALVFEVVADVYRKGQQSARCRVPITKDVVDHLASKGWHAPSCVSQP